MATTTTPDPSPDKRARIAHLIHTAATATEQRHDPPLSPHPYEKYLQDIATEYAARFVTEREAALHGMLRAAFLAGYDKGCEDAQ